MKNEIHAKRVNIDMQILLLILVWAGPAVVAFLSAQATAALLRWRRSCYRGFCWMRNFRSWAVFMANQFGDTW